MINLEPYQKVCLTSISLPILIVMTVGGNSGGAPCVLPFTYQGVRYTKCTNANHDKLWCATTMTWMTDGETALGKSLKHSNHSYLSKFADILVGTQ